MSLGRFVWASLHAPKRMFWRHCLRPFASTNKGPKRNVPKNMLWGGFVGPVHEGQKMLKRNDVKECVGHISFASLCEARKKGPKRNVPKNMFWGRFVWASLRKSDTSPQECFGAMVSFFTAFYGGGRKERQAIFCFGWESTAGLGGQSVLCPLPPDSRRAAAGESRFSAFAGPKRSKTWTPPALGPDPSPLPCNLSCAPGLQASGRRGVQVFRIFKTQTIENLDSPALGPDPPRISSASPRTHSPSPKL